MSWLKMMHAGMQLNKAAEAIWWWSSVNRGTGSRVKVHWNIPDGGQLQMTVAALLTGRKDGYFSPRNFNQEGGWVALAKCCPSTNIVHWCITGERGSQAKKANGPDWINMGINFQMWHSYCGYWESFGTIANSHSVSAVLTVWINKLNFNYHWRICWWWMRACVRVCVRACVRVRNRERDTHTQLK